MADNSATARYQGYGISTAGWQARAEDRNASPDDSDLTDDQDHDAIRLEGENGENEAFGNRKGDRVANLSVTRVSRPAKTRNLPADHRTNQNPLTAGRGLNRGRRGR
ncbi:MAG: hypothetical protein WA709_18415 [Stellaceae bacterium]